MDNWVIGQMIIESGPVIRWPICRWRTRFSYKRDNLVKCCYWKRSWTVCSTSRKFHCAESCVTPWVHGVRCRA